ncbi:MAG: AMP-binding protein, partial [Mycobacterium sp.]
MPQIAMDDMEGFVPFPADRAARYRSAGYWTGRPLDSILSAAAQRWPGQLAVLDGGDLPGPRRQHLSYAELDQRADCAAAGLTGLGIAPGDRVLLQLPNGCEFAVALFGLLRAGAIPVMCMPGHRAAELGHFAAVSQARGLLIPDATNGFDYRTMA